MRKRVIMFPPRRKPGLIFFCSVRHVKIFSFFRIHLISRCPGRLLPFQRDNFFPYRIRGDFSGQDRVHLRNMILFFYPHYKKEWFNIRRSFALGDGRRNCRHSTKKLLKPRTGVVEWNMGIWIIKANTRVGWKYALLFGVNLQYFENENPFFLIRDFWRQFLFNVPLQWVINH